MRLGNISATPDLLDAIPRSAWIAALKLHAQAGEATTSHTHSGIRFSLTTSTAGTLIDLE